MKKLIITLGILLLVGCDANTRERTQDYILPPGMEHCQIFKLNGDGGSMTLYAVSCPNSSVSVTNQHGKNDSTTTFTNTQN